MSILRNTLGQIWWFELKRCQYLFYIKIVTKYFKFVSCLDFHNSLKLQWIFVVVLKNCPIAYLCFKYKYTGCPVIYFLLSFKFALEMSVPFLILRVHFNPTWPWLFLQTSHSSGNCRNSIIFVVRKTSKVPLVVSGIFHYVVKVKIYLRLFLRSDIKCKGIFCILLLI